jgi:hypothetical protein
LSYGRSVGRLRENNLLSITVASHPE